MRLEDEEEEEEPEEEEKEGQEELSEGEIDSESEEEALHFLGNNPAAQEVDKLNIRKDLSDRMINWMKKGLSDKEEKEKILSSIDRKGELHLEAPLLNEEVSVNLNPRAFARDEYFRQYQNIIATALGNAASVLSMVLDDRKKEIDRERVLKYLSNAVKLLSDLFYLLNNARKAFLIGGYEEKTQKLLKSIEPTTYLFGDDLKTRITNAKAMEKLGNDIKPKPATSFDRPRLAHRTNNRPLNMRGSNARKGVEHSNHRTTTRTTSRVAGNRRSRSAPPRKGYPQTQPLGHRSRH